MVYKKTNTFQAKSPEQERLGLDNTPQIGDRFNLDAKLGADIAKSSPEAQQTISQLYKLEESRLVSEEKAQIRSREFRVLKEQSRLTEKFFSEPSPIPNDPEAKKLVFETIKDQAERTVAEREAYFKNQIKNQTDQNVREVIKMDQQGILPAQSQKQDQALEASQEPDDDHDLNGR